ncbi:MAG TPA: adenylate/guanylate cyclase domain-containing protein [Pyrinomonadaceae bacterium]|nr:adenylate/guanylate cyclase domain-containing protein [Pyrinomonadaceae bacterium]
MKKNTREELSRLLQERNEYPERAEAVDALIRETFGETYAVMVMDMSGFSRMTIKHGIMHFLAMIHRMNQIVAPTVSEHEGRVIKFEADNAFAVFDTVEAAIEAAIDISRRFSAANTMLPEEMDMHGKFGIGYGEILIVEESDLFGSEVNLASKLGEDLAERGEILLTEAAFAEVEAERRECEEVSMSISGLQLKVHKVVM